MPEYKRTCNKDFFYSRLTMAGHTLESLAALLDPPVTRAAIAKLISPNDPFKNERRIKQVAEILHEPDALLFPFQKIDEVRDDSRS